MKDYEIMIDTTTSDTHFIIKLDGVFFATVGKSKNTLDDVINLVKGNGVIKVC